MIRLVLGNVGSGKTASMVRMMKSTSHITYYTNINVYGKDMKHIIKLTPDMIVKKDLVSTKRDGTPVYKLKFNQEFWQDLLQSGQNISIIIDEAHQFFNPRRSMSRLNIVTTDMLSMLRRVLGSTEGQGSLTLITQLSRRLDIIAKELATEVVFCRMHYKKSCQRCKSSWIEANDAPNRRDECPICNDWRLKRSNFNVEVMHFRNINQFDSYFTFGNKCYYKRYMITDIEKVFGNYNTLQFEDLFSDL